MHAAALSLARATSLLHEAKVDVVTVPNLSEHLSSAETTEQLSARFADAAAMKSMNNLLLLGDGESWARQTVDFAGLPEMARIVLHVAAAAAGAAGPTDLLVGGDRRGGAHLRVPSAVAARRAGQGGTRAVPRAGHAGLRGAEAWPDAVMARLAEAQPVADGTYPNAAAVFAEHEQTDQPTAVDPDELALHGTVTVTALAGHEAQLS